MTIREIRHGRTVYVIFGNPRRFHRLVHRRALLRKLAKGA